MPSSDSSSSSLEFLGSFCPRSARAVATEDATADSAATVAGVVAAPTPSGPVGAERYVSSLSQQRAVDSLCRKHGVPEAYTALLAGDLRACSVHPEGALCVYAHALEAGVRVPLHEFFCQVLNHFDLAPSQLSPNGWRVLLGFLVLCHDAGVPPSLVLFLHFFYLVNIKPRGWYFFRAKNARNAAARLLFQRLPKCNKEWKDMFFFLRSPKPWPCPVRWGEPKSKCSFAVRKLTSEEDESVTKLLGVHGTAVDLRTYLCEKNLAAALSSNLADESPPPPASVRPTSTGAKGTDQYAEKAAVSACRTEKVKTEHTPALSGKKRSLEEANSNDEPLPASFLFTSTGAQGIDQSAKKAILASSASQVEKVKTELGDHTSAPSGKKSTPEEANSNDEDGPGYSELNSLGSPPGFKPKPRHLPVPDARDIDNAEMLKTVNCARELEKKLAERAAARAELEKKEAEVIALWEQLKQGKKA